MTDKGAPLVTYQVVIYCAMCGLPAAPRYRYTDLAGHEFPVCDPPCDHRAVR